MVAGVWGQVELPSALVPLVKVLVLISPVRSVTIPTTVMGLILPNASSGTKNCCSKFCRRFEKFRLIDETGLFDRTAPKGSSVVTKLLPHCELLIFQSALGNGLSIPASRDVNKQENLLLGLPYVFLCS